MKKIEAFTNQYPVSKTLRFSLIPQGKTEENFDAKLLLEEDEKRAENYRIVKGYIDCYHKTFIEDILCKFQLKGLSSYANLYYKTNKTAEEKAEMEKLADSFRKEISKEFSSDERFKNLFSKEMIRQLLPEILNDEEQLEILHGFYDFTTYFVGFYDNRKNMYSSEAKSTSIAFRLIDQNLPKFLDNCKIGKIILSTISEDSVKEMGISLAQKIHVEIGNIFEIDFFNKVLSQSGIDIYNQLIGGYTTENGAKVKGINEYVNEYNQISERKLPKLRPLYKQILSDRSTLSFIPEKFKTSQEVLDSLNAFLVIPDEETGKTGNEVIGQLENMMAELDNYDLDKIHISSGLDITALSNKVFGDWSVIQRGLDKQYDEANGALTAKNKEKFAEKRSKYFKSIKSFSISELQQAGDCILGEESKSITEYYKTAL